MHLLSYGVCFSFFFLQQAVSVKTYTSPRKMIDPISKTSIACFRFKYENGFRQTTCYRRSTGISAVTQMNVKSWPIAFWTFFRGFDIIQQTTTHFWVFTNEFITNLSNDFIEVNTHFAYNNMYTLSSIVFSIRLH